MDTPLNGGFICEKHEIGYISECPSCASEEGEFVEFLKGMYRSEKVTEEELDTWVPVYFRCEQIGEVRGDSEPGMTFDAGGQRFLLRGYDGEKQGYTASALVGDKHGLPRIID